MATDIGLLTNQLQGTLGVGLSDSKAAIEDLCLVEVFNANKELADAAASTTSTMWACKVPFKCVVEEAVICPAAALTAADATAAVLTLAKADGAGGAATTVAAITTNLASGNWVADTFKSMTVTAADATVNDGQLLTLKITKTSTGTVVPACTVSIRVRKV